MSTYLLAFIVGEYDYLEATDTNGVLIRVYTALGKKEWGRFALDVRELNLFNSNNTINFQVVIVKGCSQNIAILHRLL